MVIFQPKAICISTLYFSYKSSVLMLYIAAFYLLGIPYQILINEAELLPPPPGPGGL